MKTVVLSIPEGNLDRCRDSLNHLSGVLAVDIQGTEATVHCGDELEDATLLSRAGDGAHIKSQRYEG